MTFPSPDDDGSDWELEGDKRYAEMEAANARGEPNPFNITAEEQAETDRMLRDLGILDDEEGETDELSDNDDYDEAIEDDEDKHEDDDGWVASSEEPKPDPDFIDNDPRPREERDIPWSEIRGR